MAPQQHNTKTTTTATPALPAGEFTPEQIAALVALREVAARRSPYDELGLDEKRLKFARWLYEHGRITEDVAEKGRRAA